MYFTFFISFISWQNYPPFLIYRLTAPCPHRFRTLVSSLPMMPCAERLTFFMGFGFFQGFEVSNSDTWGQNIFSISKSFTCYFWLQNAHKPNTKMQWFLITIVRRFFLDGNVSWRRESARKGLNMTSGAQFAALPLVKPVVSFVRAVVNWRSRSIAKSA